MSPCATEDENAALASASNSDVPDVPGRGAYRSLTQRNSRRSRRQSGGAGAGLWVDGHIATIDDSSTLPTSTTLIDQRATAGMRCSQSVDGATAGAGALRTKNAHKRGES